MKLLMDLLNAPGISGSEGCVRNLIIKELRKHVDDIVIDKMGNLIGHKKGKLPRVMLAAHMDEVGLMIKNIDEQGDIWCSEIGFLDAISLLGERVSIRTKHGKVIKGIITTREICNNSKTVKVPSVYDLFVDTGLGRGELIELGVEVGSYLHVGREATLIGNGKAICGKAIDDRFGCYALIELAKRLKGTNYETYFAFTVQEEIGLYGAKTSAYTIEPDWSIAVDVNSSDDKAFNPTRILGKGPCVCIKDANMISNKCINDWLIGIAKKHKIPIQLDVSDIGTTDAMNISLTRGGVPSTVVGVPIRNLHSTVEIASVDDINNCIKLLELLLKNPPKVCLV